MTWLLLAKITMQVWVPPTLKFPYRSAYRREQLHDIKFSIYVGFQAV